ncbi:phosphoribosyltransferase family protein [Echinicola jeungdonensis]|uniref:Phosphoribosyltransferase n=1 Tax=Echinicola jeungdonensis TaxID=709343 RepID=A0ABV5JB09_9BACT|nr:phosphoribosyltransferase family protein [Echinicola jeungdonensis]MDN3670542.1 phosphoribosyltransferase family protein [Echinicola jeungdonensis]
MYKDREEAGVILARELFKYKDSNAIVVGIPRGGVPVAYELAKALHLPLEIILTKKLGYPGNKEYAIGAVGLKDLYLTTQSHIPEEYIQEEIKDLRDRLQEMDKKFNGNRNPLSLKGKTVLLIDDGIATGITLHGTIQVLKHQKPARIILAVPVAPQDSLDQLASSVDEIICPLIPKSLYAVGQFYYNFYQVSDDEVLELLQEAEKAGFQNKS